MYSVAEIKRLYLRLLSLTNRKPVDSMSVYANVSFPNSNCDHDLTINIGVV